MSMMRDAALRWGSCDVWADVDIDCNVLFFTSEHSNSNAKDTPQRLGFAALEFHCHKWGRRRRVPVEHPFGKRRVEMRAHDLARMPGRT
jgi:hypothetical protein